MRDSDRLIIEDGDADTAAIAALIVFSMATALASPVMR